MTQVASKYILDKPDQAEIVARKILSDTKGKKVFTLEGPMGAGKTTLIKGFCKALGVEGQTSSPTFAVINEYHAAGNEKIFHFDCYRLKSPMEALDLGCEEYFYSGHYCFIEWPEMLGELVPAEAVSVKIEVNGTSRSISVI